MASCALTVAPGLSAALTTDEARHLVRAMVGEILEISATASSDTEFYRRFERIFDKYGDIPVVAQATLGRAWRSANDSQRRRYIEAYRSYLARKYGRKLREMTGGRVQIGKSRKVKSFFEVQSVARLADGRKFEVLWHVSDRSGRSRMFNIIIEGISMLNSERTEIAAMLRRRNGNIDAVTSDLAKAA